MRRPLILAIALTALLAPAPAGAATLTLDNGVLTFTADAQTVNLVRFAGGPTVEIERLGTDNDPLASPPPGCLGADPQRAQTCPNVSRLVVDLRDGDDNVNAAGLTGVAVSATGGDGDDTLSGGPLADTLDGGAGGDTIRGASGADTLRGGTGDDPMSGGDGDDNLDGQDGDDGMDGNGGADVITGGAGIDHASYGDERSNVDVSLDDVANDGAPGEGDNVLSVEDVTVTAAETGSARITGNAAGNLLDVSGGPGTIVGGDGADIMAGGPRDDTLHARDGWPDRVVCGGGNDTALVDQLDTVSQDCENAPVEIVHGGLDDRPPTVTWSAPAVSARARGDQPMVLAADASDDRGVAKVQFFDDDRLVCEVMTPPYTCNYQARAADVGRNTLVVTAVDGANQATSVVRPVVVTRFRPSSLSLRLRPSRDRRAPYSFRARGTLAGAPECSGTVRVTAKAGRRTVSSRRARLRGNCTYSLRVRFGSRPATRLRFSARFAGNDSTLPRSARRRTARLG